MSTNQIEKNGILCLKYFISESKIIDPYIDENDKYPSWDGELLVYQEENHNCKKEMLLGRVPVQVKSKQGKWKPNESFSLEVSDLRNYMEDGGIILLRPIYIKPIESFRIFCAILLPTVIYKYLKNAKGNSKSIKLSHIKDIEQLEANLKYFLHNRKLQFNYDEEVESHYLKDGFNEFVMKGLKDTSKSNLLFPDEYCIYLKGEHENLIPTSLELRSLQTSENHNISVNGKKFFKSIIREINNDGSQKLILNSVLFILLVKELSELRFNINEKSSIHDICKSIEFLELFFETNEIEYDNLKLHFTVDSKSHIDSLEMQFWYDVHEILNRFKYDPRLVLKEEIDNKHREFKILIQMMIYNESVLINNEINNFLVKTLVINNRTNIFVFEKLPNGTYIGNNLFIGENKNIELIVNGNPIPCSRYLILFTVFKFDLYKHIDAILNFEEEMKIELETYYDEKLYDSYIHLMLALIKGYDYGKLLNGLDLADWLISILIVKISNIEYLDILKINKYQVAKRRGNLIINQIKDLIEISNRNEDRIDMQCCISILLEDYEKFQKLFVMLEPEKKEEFYQWPIWYLVKNPYNKQMMQT